MRRVSADVHTPTSSRADLSSDPIYLHHPSAREDLQSPLALQHASPTHAPVYIDNYYINGIRSSTATNDNSFDIYLFLPNHYDSESDLLELLHEQLRLMETAGYPTSTCGLEHLIITTISHLLPNYELDDEPSNNTTHLIPASFTTHPYKYKLILPTNSPESYGLLLLASCQQNGKP